MYRVCKRCLTHVESTEQSCPFCQVPLEEASSPPGAERGSVARISGKSSMLAAALGVTLSLNVACNKIAPEPQPTLYGGPPIEEPVAEEPTPVDMGSGEKSSDASKDMKGAQGAASGEGSIQVNTPGATIYGGPPVDIYGAPPVDEDELEPQPEPDSEE